MNRDQIEHEPVLCGPLMAWTAPRLGEIVVDATVGHGGHACLLARAIGPTGRLIALDVDAYNLRRAKARLERAGLAEGGPHIDLIRDNFANLGGVLDRLGVDRVDVIIVDLGVSTDQLLCAGRGLTFAETEPLDMRLDDRLTMTAADLINSLSESQLADLIYSHSQERRSRRIARRICQARRDGPIRTTAELVRIVCSALGVSVHSRPGRLHPATRTFMALRMAVNRETENLTTLLKLAPTRLSPGGRIAVISFHSGEDRLVKRDFLARQRLGVYEVRTKKPIRPSDEEVSFNPRSRSAKLRVAVRTADVQEVA
ncbi:MAG: 16S rRNA (cytosine(1402)-N(4))-methyltransferase RsmH [Phycisphaerae bacterium]